MSSHAGAKEPQLRTWPLRGNSNKKKQQRTTTTTTINHMAYLNIYLWIFNTAFNYNWAVTTTTITMEFHNIRELRAQKPVQRIQSVQATYLSTYLQLDSGRASQHRHHSHLTEFWLSKFSVQVFFFFLSFFVIFLFIHIICSLCVMLTYWLTNL